MRKLDGTMIDNAPWVAADPTFHGVFDGSERHLVAMQPLSRYNPVVVRQGADGRHTPLGNAAGQNSALIATDL